MPLLTKASVRTRMSRFWERSDALQSVARVALRTFYRVFAAAHRTKEGIDLLPEVDIIVQARVGGGVPSHLLLQWVQPLNDLPMKLLVIASPNGVLPIIRESLCAHWVEVATTRELVRLLALNPHLREIPQVYVDFGLGTFELLALDRKSVV